MLRMTMSIVVLVLAVACSTGTSSQSTPTASATTIPSATPTPVAVTAAPAYVNSSYKYSLVLPEPYRHSDQLSLESTGRPALQDVLTPRTPTDEATTAGSGQTASPAWNYVAVVQIYTGVSDTPRGFYTTSGGAVGESIIDTTVDGRQAIKVTNGAPYPLQYLIKDGSRMLRVAYQIYPDMAVPAGATRAKLIAILESFRFTP